MAHSHIEMIAMVPVLVSFYSELFSPVTKHLESELRIGNIYFWLKVSESQTMICWFQIRVNLTPHSSQALRGRERMHAVMNNPKHSTAISFLQETYLSIGHSAMDSIVNCLPTTPMLYTWSFILIYNKCIWKAVRSWGCGSNCVRISFYTKAPDRPYCLFHYLIHRRTEADTNRKGTLTRYQLCFDPGLFTHTDLCNCPQVQGIQFMIFCHSCLNGARQSL